METYIDFINKYNKTEASKSSSNSDFDNFLKGGSNNIKGGFPPVYPVDTRDSESFREFSPNLKIVDVLQKNPKTPFLNINANEGGFLNLFNSKKNKNENLKNVDLKKNLTQEILPIKTEKDENKQFNDTSIDLPSDLEVISIDKNDFTSKNQNSLTKSLKDEKK